MKAKIIGLDGSKKGELELPKVFETEYKPEIIKRAVLAIQTARLQPKGSDPGAGLKNTAEYVGNRGKATPQRTINVGKARLPRTKNRKHLLYGRVARVPQAVGGMKPHSPKSWKIIEEKINKKERKIALESAIGATTNKELVGKRFLFNTDLPIIISEEFEEMKSTKEAIKILEKIGVGEDLKNSKEKIKGRAGKGKRRGRTKKIKKSVLIVSGSNKPVLKAVRNIPGVDAVTIRSLNVELLAPGTEAGRLVVWTKNAIKEIENGKKATKEVTKEKKEETEKKTGKKKKATKKKPTKKKSLKKVKVKSVKK